MSVRGVFTLAGAGGAGLLVWIATQIGTGYTGGYWAVYGLLAGAGLTLALSQLFGGWTKWGVPRVSIGVFVLGFLPALVCAGWILLAGQPNANWFQGHTTSWSGDIGIDGVVDDLRNYLSVLAFGLGLIFGFTFDTTGPVRSRRPPVQQPLPPPDLAPPPPEATIVEPASAEPALRPPSHQGSSAP